MHRNTICSLISTSLLFFGLSAQSVFAQEDNDFEKFKVSIGAFFPGADTTVRLDASNGSLGSEIKFEDDLGGSRNEALFRFDGYWRFKQHHAFTFGYYDFKRSGTKIIDKTLNFGDQTYSINSQINSFFNIQIFKAAYTYIPIDNEKTLVGLSAGFNVSALDTGIEIDDRSAAESSSPSIPVPVIGVNGVHQLGGNFSLEGSAQLFYLEVGSIGGKLFDGRLSLNYRFTKNFGVGLGYNLFNLKVTKDSSAFTGKFKLKYDGLMAFMNLYY